MKRERAGEREREGERKGKRDVAREVYSGTKEISVAREREKREKRRGGCSSS